MSSKCAKKWDKFEENGCSCGGRRVTRISSFVVKLSSSGALTDAPPSLSTKVRPRAGPGPAPASGRGLPGSWRAGASQEASQVAPRPVPKNLHGPPASFYPTSSFLSKKNRETDRGAWLWETTISRSSPGAQSEGSEEGPGKGRRSLTSPKPPLFPGTRNHSRPGGGITMRQD